MNPQFQVHDQFYSSARLLRQVFDKKFNDPLKTHSERFVWDYWHVPGEYTLLRTPAPNYFPPRLYQAFHRHLVLWGRANLGCHDISPPWLSCYIQGCRQFAHQDVPHGPLAFVYSLTPWSQRQFSGGETFLKIGPTKKLIPSLFNRLLVFNPALTHGVTEVKGVQDPRKGRLVIHGWFVNPRPFWYGPLSSQEVSAGIEQGLKSLNGSGLGQGLLSLRLSISREGQVTKVKTLMDTLQKAKPTDLASLYQLIKKMEFKKKRASTELTLPLMMS